MEGKTRKSIAKELLTLIYFVIFGNGPWLIAVMFTVFLGYLLIPLLSQQSIEIYSKVVIPSLPISLILSSWIQVLVTKKIFDYEALRKIYSARRLIIFSVILTTAVVTSFYMIFFGINIIGKGGGINESDILQYLMTLALSLMWVGLAPLNGLQKYFQMTMLFSSGMLFSGVLTYYFTVMGFNITYILIAYVIGYFISAVAMYFYLLFGIFRSPKLTVKLDRALISKIIEVSRNVDSGEKLAKLLPIILKVQERLSPDQALIILNKAELEMGQTESLREMLSGNFWLLVSNLLYFLFIWQDRFVVWIKEGMHVEGLFIGFNSFYEIGINVVQWALIPTVGVAAYLMSEFTPTLLKSLNKLYTGTLDEIKISLRRFIHDIYYRAGLLLVFATSITLVFVIFSDHILMFFNLKNEVSRFVLHVGAIGVIFHALMIYEFLVLMYLQRLKDNALMMSVGLITAACIDVYFFLFGSYHYIIYSYVIGALVTAAVGIILIKIRVSELYYYFLSKAI